MRTRSQFIRLIAAGLATALVPAAPRPLFARLASAATSEDATTSALSAGPSGSPAGDIASGQDDPLVSALGTADFRANLPEQSLYIMVATDMHFISPRLTDHGAYFEALIRSSDAKVMDYSEQIMDTLVQAAITEKPDVLVIPGDLTYNGARESHEDIAEKLDLIRAAGVPVVVIPGNHDIDCPQAARFEGDGYELVDSVSAHEFAQIYADFGYGDGHGAGRTLARDDASLSYVWELADGLRLLMLDVNGTPSLGTAQQGSAAPQTIDWLDDQLVQAARDGARVLAFSHQSMLQQTFIDYGYVVANAAEILELYKRHGVLANLCGHLHLQHYETDEDGFCDIATSALSVSPCQFARVVLASQADAPASAAPSPAGDPSWLAGPLSLSYHTAPMDAAVAALAAQRACDDPNLLDFPAYAKTFFVGDEQRRAATAEALEEAGFSDARELADFSADVNYHYFTGRLDQMEYRPDLIDAWNKVDLLTGYYMRYIFEVQQVRNQNEVSVETI